MYVPAVLMKFIHHEGNRSTKIQYAARAENNKIQDKNIRYEIKIKKNKKMKK